MKVGPRLAVDRDVDGLAGHDVAAVLLRHLGAGFEMRGVDQIGYRLAGECHVADTVFRERREREDDAAERLEVLPPRDIAFERRADLELVDHPFRSLDRQLRLHPLRLQLGAGSAGRVAADRHVALQLCELLSRLFKQDDVLLRLQRTDKIVGACVQLGAADLEPRVQQRHFVFRRFHRVGGRRLRDLLPCLLQVELRLLEIERRFGGIELDDRIAGLDGGTRFGERDDLQLAAGGRREDLCGAPGADLAGRVDGDLHRAALDARRRDRLGVGRRAPPARGAGQQPDGDCGNGNRSTRGRHRSSTSGSFSAMRWPSATPVTTA